MAKNFSRLITLFNEDIIVIEAVYESLEEKPNQQRYQFKTLDHALEVGDLINVPADTTRHGVTTVKIVEVGVEIDLDSSNELRWVIDKVNLKEHEHIIEEEKKWITAYKKSEDRKRKEEMKKNMIDMLDDPDIDLSSLGIAGLKASSQLEDKTEKEE